NASNLLTDPTDPKHLGGLGGWELIEMSPSPNLNTPVGTNVPVSLPNNISINFCSVTNAGTTFTSTTKNPFRWYQSVNPLLAPSDINGPPLPPGVGRQPSDLILLWT